MTTRDYYVLRNPKLFEPKRLVVEHLNKNSGGQGHSAYVKYLDDEGNKKNLYIQAPKLFAPFGFNKFTDTKTKRETYSLGLLVDSTKQDIVDYRGMLTSIDDTIVKHIHENGQKYFPKAPGEEPDDEKTIRRSYTPSFRMGKVREDGTRNEDNMQKCSIAYRKIAEELELAKAQEEAGGPRTQPNGKKERKAQPINPEQVFGDICIDVPVFSGKERVPSANDPSKLVPKPLNIKYAIDAPMYATPLLHVKNVWKVNNNTGIIYALKQAVIYPIDKLSNACDIEVEENAAPDEDELEFARSEMRKRQRYEDDEENEDVVSSESPAALHKRLRNDDSRKRRVGDDGEQGEDESPAAIHKRLRSGGDVDSPNAVNEDDDAPQFPYK